MRVLQKLTTPAKQQYPYNSNALKELRVVKEADHETDSDSIKPNDNGKLVDVFAIGILGQTPPLSDRLFIKDEYEYVRILLSEIDFVKANGNYIEIHGHGKKRLIKNTLKEVALKLDSNFFHVHRSYIVNVKKIERIGGNCIWVERVEIPVNRQRRDELLCFFNVLH